jgi:hypothetical protein
MSQKKQIKVQFAPGCFDTFEGTQEELDELVKTLQNMSMEEILDSSLPIDSDDLDDDELDQILGSMNQSSNRTIN